MPDEEREGSDEGSETTLDGSGSGGSQTSLANWQSRKLANKPNKLLFAKAVKLQNYKRITGRTVLVFLMGAELGEQVEKLSDKELSQAIHKKLVRSPVGGGRNRIPPPPLADQRNVWSRDENRKRSRKDFTTS